MSSATIGNRASPTWCRRRFMVVGSQPGPGSDRALRSADQGGNMRKVVSGLFVSLDGVAEAPDQWQFEFDEEMGAALTTTLETADTVLLGRVTYTEWAGYWPTVTSG